MADTQTSKQPSHYLYAVTKRNGADKGNWTKIGAAWPNSDRKGFSFKFDSFPVNGANIVMRTPKDKGAVQ